MNEMNDLNEEEEEEEEEETQFVFECERPEKGCYHKNEDGKIEICNKSPCELNLFKFGTHSRIISYYLENEEWADALYYFNNLSSSSSFECDLNKLDALKQSGKILETKDYPLGCRVFLIESQLGDTIEMLNKYKKLESENGLSQKGTLLYNDLKIKFRKRLKDNLAILKHISMDKREKKGDIDNAHKRQLITIKALGKANIPFRSQIGTEVDKGINRDDNILMGNDPRLQEDHDIFHRHAFLKKVEEKEARKKEEAIKNV